ncbi:MAG: hypothetical protein IJ165_15460 [Proteobacteria bacterium]|nr:hypothetical protein [Pseudomonadota bacterium]
MKRTHQALLALAAAGLLFMPACKKATQENGDAPAVQQLAAAPTVSDWNKADVNSLLAFVPEDTAFVQASTRQLDLTDANLKKLLDKAASSLDGSIADVQKNIDEIKDPADPKAAEALKTVLASLKEYRDLIKDFEHNAPAWGLDPLGHFDAIAYTRDQTLVMQATLVDSAKCKEKVVQSINAYLSLTEEQVTHEEIKSGASDWLVYSAKKLLDSADISDDPSVKSVIPSKLAINFGPQRVTAVLISDSFDTNTLENFLKPAEKPLSKDALGKIEPTTVQTGYLDITKLVKALTSPNGLSLLRALNLIEGEATEACIKEYNDIAAITPRILMTSDIDGENTITKITTVLSDKDALASLNALRTKRLSVTTDKSLMALNVNLDIKNAIAYIKSLSAAITAKNYQCSTLKDIPEMLNSVIEVVTNPQILAFINGISGLNVAVDKLDLKADPIAVEAIANLTGPTVGTTAPLLLGLAAAGEPQLSKLILTKGQPANDIELNIDKFAIKLNGMLTDTDLIYATQAYDIKTISESTPKDANFIDLMLDYALVSALPADYQESLGSFKDFIMTISLGTDDKGITFTTTSKYH